MAPNRIHWRRGKDDCLTDCVARIFNVHPETVPLFCAHKNWPRKLKRYFNARGMGIKCVTYTPGLLGNDYIGIVVGRSARGVYHAVLYIGNRVIFDPAYRPRPFIEPPVQCWLPYRITKDAARSLVPACKVPAPIKRKTKRSKRPTKG